MPALRRDGRPRVRAWDVAAIRPLMKFNAPVNAFNPRIVLLFLLVSEESIRCGGVVQFDVRPYVLPRLHGHGPPPPPRTRTNYHYHYYHY